MSRRGTCTMFEWLTLLSLTYSSLTRITLRLLVFLSRGKLYSIILYLRPPTHPKPTLGVHHNSSTPFPQPQIYISIPSASLTPRLPAFKRHQVSMSALLLIFTHLESASSAHANTLALRLSLPARHQQTTNPALPLNLSVHVPTRVHSIPPLTPAQAFHPTPHADTRIPRPRV